MKKLSLLCSFVLIIAAAVSCNKIYTTNELISPDTSPVLVKGFVGTYFRLSQIEGINHVSLQEADDPAGYTICLSFKTTKLLNYASGDIYDTYCEKYGDTSFNKCFNKPSDGSPLVANEAIDNDFKSLEITCLSEFMGRPAGSSVGDIIVFSSKSALPFIKSGYTNPQIQTYGEYNGVPIVNEGDGMVKISKKVSELTQEDMTLLSGDIYLTFTEFPSESVSCPFFVKFTNGSGQVIQKEISVNFAE